MLTSEAGIRLGLDEPVDCSGTSRKAFLLIVVNAVSDSRSTEVSLHLSQAMSPISVTVVGSLSVVSFLHSMHA